MRCHRTIAFAAGPLLLCLALAGSAAADIVHYKDGRTIEGRIVERTATEIVVETDFGRVRVPLAKVERIEVKETVREEFTRRRGALKPDDVAGLFELAVWTRDHDLQAEEHELLLAVIKAMPDHQLANEMLGRKPLDGRWFEPAELDAYVRSMEAEKKAQGFLFDGGRWEPEAEVMTRRGFKLWKGEWKPRREAETLAAVEDLATMAKVEVTATSGEFVTLFSPLDEEDASILVGTLDNVVRDVLLRLQPLPDERATLVKYDVPFFLLPDEEAVARFMDSGFVVRFSPVDGFEQKFRDAGGFSLYWPRPMIGMRLTTVDGGPRDEVQRLGVVTHQLMHVLVQRFKGRLQCPAWLETGLAAIYEGKATGDGCLTITSFRRTRDGREPLDPFVKDWTDYNEWQAHLADPDQLATVPALQTLVERPVEDLDSRDIGICWSFTRFLLAQHADEMVSYLRHYAEHPDGKAHAPGELHEEAWAASFAEPLDVIEAEWRAWAAEQPKVLDPERLTH